MKSTPCEMKKRYESKKDARTALNFANTQRGRHGRAENLRIYPCDECRGWHLTKQPKR